MKLQSLWFQLLELVCKEMRSYLHYNIFYIFFFNRREAASNVLKQSAARQRSYVLSAAKKFEYVSQHFVYFEPFLKYSFFFLLKYKFEVLVLHFSTLV